MSFSRATNNAVVLETAIVPLTQPALDQRLDTDWPDFGPSDWRGVTFAAPIPSRFTPNQTARVEREGLEVKEVG